MKFIKQLLDAKGHQLWSVMPENFVYDAIDLMAEKGIGALLVMDGQQLVGVVSERDYARKVILKGRSSHMTPVSDIMTREVITVSPHQSIEECMGIMTKERIRHLPVLEEGMVVGMVSIGDLVKSTMAEQQFVIEQLEDYIKG